MKKIEILSVMFLLLIFSACRKDVYDVKVVEGKPDPVIIDGYVPQVENVQSSVTGYVVDENEEPVIGAKVVLNNETVTTDAFGHFFYKNKTMNARGTLVQIEKEGYFPGSRRFFPTEGVQSNVKIQLLKKSFDQSFSTQTGGKIASSSGAAVQFAANSIRMENGANYDGEVQIALQWLDPSALATLDQMPGNLQGVNTSNDEIGLMTYGMMAVELQSPAGEALNIAEGFTATLNMPVPASMRDDAPATIPLWYYHEALGIWVEDGAAVLQDGVYVGEVTHFTFWNCDLPIGVIKLDMTFVTRSGWPLSNWLITLINNDVFSIAGDYTHENGRVSGLVPVNVGLTYNVVDVCGKVVASGQIGPFDTDTSLEPITVNNTSIPVTQVSGKLVDCEGLPINNGMVSATFDGRTTFFYVNSADFDWVLVTCSVSTTDIEIVAYDLDNLLKSSPTTVAPNSSSSIGTMLVCGQDLQSYIMVSVDGVDLTFPDVELKPAISSTRIVASYVDDLNNWTYLIMSFDGLIAGDYSETGNFLGGIKSDERKWNLLAPLGERGFSSFIVTEYNDAFVKGTFSGPVRNTIPGTVNNPPNKMVEGEFVIRL